MELSAIKQMLEWTGAPAFAVAGGRLLVCSEEALALGLETGASVAALLPWFEPPQPGDAPTEAEVLLGGRRWVLRASPAEECALCFLRPAPEGLPGPNESTLLHTAGAIRLGLQELTLALNDIAEAERDTPSVAEHMALALRSVYRLRKTAGDLELFAALRNGTYRLRPAQCFVGASVTRLCGDLNDLLRAAGVTLTWELPAPDFLLRVDWPLLAALLREMVANAADTVDGQLRLTLTRGEGRKLRFALRNRPARPLPEALFHRHAAEQSDLRGGTGLGLSLLSIGAACHGGVFLLSPDERGFVTALLSVEGCREDTKPVLKSSFRDPNDPNESLAALSGVLPVSVYHPEGLLY